MSGFALLINLTGAILILAIVWWFWLYHANRAVNAAQGVIDIAVIDGTYKPDVIKTKRGQPVHLRFIRKDETPCSATVIFADFDQSAELPLNQPVELMFTPQKSGHFDFTCQMGMYRGRLIVDP